MVSIDYKLVGFIKKHPKKFFLIIPVLTGYAVFFSYAIQNGFFLMLDFNLLPLTFMVGMAPSLFFLAMHCILNYILNKCRITEYIKYNFHVIFLICIIIFVVGFFQVKLLNL